MLGATLDVRPILEALPVNHHLRDLDISGHAVNANQSFLHSVLLPAVHANTSLRELRMYRDDNRGGTANPRPAAAAEAIELVQSRPRDWA